MCQMGLLRSGSERFSGVARLALIVLACSLALFISCGDDENTNPLESGNDLRQGTSTLKDLDDELEETEPNMYYTFDFSEGKMIKESGLTGDFVFDDGNYGGELFGLPTGRNIIKDMGTVSLESVREAPETGYEQRATDILDHVYCIITKENHYAKIKVKSVTVESMTFDWVYREGGGRNF